jgi:hypothetical protein
VAGLSGRCCRLRPASCIAFAFTHCNRVLDEDKVLNMQYARGNLARCILSDAIQAAYTVVDLLHPGQDLWMDYVGQAWFMTGP